MAFNMKGSPMKRNFNIGASPMKQPLLTCPECGIQIENTDGSGAALQTHMQTAHLSTGGTQSVVGPGPQTAQNVVGGGPAYSNPGGWTDPNRGPGFDTLRQYTGGTNFPV